MYYTVVKYTLEKIALSPEVVKVLLCTIIKIKKAQWALKLHLKCTLQRVLNKTTTEIAQPTPLDLQKISKEEHRDHFYGRVKTTKLKVNLWIYTNFSANNVLFKTF